MAHVLIQFLASLWYEQSNERLGNTGFAASQMFVACFQHARQVATQTTLNLFSLARQVLAPRLRPPCCMDSLRRDPAPVAPWQSSQAGSFQK